MTDRELLEMAAKAAGLKIAFGGMYRTDLGTLCSYQNGESHIVPVSPGGCPTRWCPVTNDGDALRLAVKLQMNVFQVAESAYALPSEDDGTYELQVRYLDLNGDPFAATRLAIVRAAAEIGRAMP